MERAYERTVGTVLVVVGAGLLLFGFAQAYEYTVHPPTGDYPIFNLGGSGGGNGSLNGSFNGRFVEAFAFLGIEYLVGAAILRGGWNLITPKAETLSVRVKPRSLQVEPIAAAAPPAFSAGSGSSPTPPPPPPS